MLSSSGTSDAAQDSFIAAGGKKAPLSAKKPPYTRGPPYLQPPYARVKLQIRGLSYRQESPLICSLARAYAKLPAASHLQVIVLITASTPLRCQQQCHAYGTRATTHSLERCVVLCCDTCFATLAH